MKDSGRLLWLTTGLILGAVGALGYFQPGAQALAANDRFEDYIMCTGPVGITSNLATRGVSTTDGVWLLDYRTGKLMCTVIDRSAGKIVGWAELDLMGDFGIPPRQNSHFLMTTGNINQAQAALYVAETTTGKFGVYTMGPRVDGQVGIAIRKHDMAPFRQPHRPE